MIGMARRKHGRDKRRIQNFGWKAWREEIIQKTW